MNIMKLGDEKKMSARELMIYQISARGKFVKEHQENIKKISYKSRTESSITFIIQGVKTGEDKEITVSFRKG